MGNQIDRCIKIIEVLSEHGPIGIEKLFELTKIPMSTIFKILKLLEKNDIVFAEQAKTEYKVWFLTLKLLRISKNILDRFDIKEKIKDVLIELSNEVKQIVQLAIYNYGKVMYIEVIKTKDSIINCASIGTERDINVSAAGMLLAAHQDDREISNLLEKTKFIKRTEYTPTSKREIKKEFEKILKNGYSYDNQQYAIGIRCLAAPVYNFAGKVIAAITITGHISTFLDENISFLKKKLLNAASIASKRMGY